MAHDYDAYAEEFRAYAAQWERGGPGCDPMGIAPRLLDWAWRRGRARVLDAGCSDGYLARFLARYLAVCGARVASVGTQDTTLPPGGQFPRFILLTWPDITLCSRCRYTS